ncbi:PREDICTED: putative fidgetin-like protein 2 [Charadrius vociferus]|uniref:putative fidgetin-like protein 2 n=1 Tax=Charadrius vociferus TaxID=50402 RepID=UPI000521C323|nr:PREDICTED: putative fidgetin-like protein 2 [Charadrius vociferus]
MHWSPEHAQSLNQWPEQHLDVSSTTSSPAHKSDLYPSTRQRFNYAWANDDISALTASNLLKRYAEKYSGVLDAPYERPALSGYGDGAFGPVNGQKGDGEPWPVAHGSDGAYPLAPIHDGLPAFPLRLPPKAPVFSSPPVEEQPKNVDPLVLELVNTKIVDRGPPVQWTDIAGQVSVKATIEEELVWPILRPGAYTGASRPPRTILLFGPHGTGKTLLSRCISTQLGSTLLKLSGTTLLSTWKAEAEKILQTVFFVASCRQPAVVLITEAESLLEARAGEDGSQVSNLKSQLLSYLDNVATSSDQNVVIIGTTSRPGSMDEASHRRFAKRFYVAPPDSIARRQILHHALAQQSSCLSEREMASLVQHTESFSGSELVQLCQHAGATTLHGLPGQIQPTSYQDFEKAFCKVRPAASQKELDLFLEWDKMYGTRH